MRFNPSAGAKSLVDTKQATIGQMLQTINTNQQGLDTAVNQPNIPIQIRTSVSLIEARIPNANETRNWVNDYQTFPSVASSDNDYFQFAQGQDVTIQRLQTILDEQQRVTQSLQAHQAQQQQPQQQQQVVPPMHQQVAPNLQQQQQQQFVAPQHQQAVAPNLQQQQQQQFVAPQHQQAVPPMQQPLLGAVQQQPPSGQPALTAQQFIADAQAAFSDEQKKMIEYIENQMELIDDAVKCASLSDGSKDILNKRYQEYHDLVTKVRGFQFDQNAALGFYNGERANAAPSLQNALTPQLYAQARVAENAFLAPGRTSGSASSLQKKAEALGFLQGSTPNQQAQLLAEVKVQKGSVLAGLQDTDKKSQESLSYITQTDQALNSSDRATLQTAKKNHSNNQQEFKVQTDKLGKSWSIFKAIIGVTIGVALLAAGVMAIAATAGAAIPVFAGVASALHAVHLAGAAAWVAHAGTAVSAHIAGAGMAQKVGIGAAGAVTALGAAAYLKGDSKGTIRRAVGQWEESNKQIDQANDASARHLK